jgi:hypothetical protein
MIVLFSTDGPDTMAEVSANEDSLTAGVEGRGFARCTPDDVYSGEIGRNIALGRAIQDFGRKVEQKGHDACVTKDEFDRVIDLITSEVAETRSAFTASVLEALDAIDLG